MRAPDTEVMPLSKHSQLNDLHSQYMHILLGAPSDCARCYFGTKEWHLSQSHQP